MAEFDFDTPIDRRSGDSVKWNRYAGRDVLPLWVADMDFRAPPCVLAALHARADHGVFGYAQAPDELRPVIVDHLRRDCDWTIEPDWLVWLPGLVSGLHLACLALAEAGDAVASLTPVYPPFLHAPTQTGRQLVTAPLLERGGHWQPDWEALERAITPRTRLLLLCHPHNPVGRAWDNDELARFAALARRHDLLVCSDEIHAGLLLDPAARHRPFATLDADAAARSVTLMAPSKTYNLPGLGFSFAVIANADLRRRWRATMTGIVPEVNAFGYAAALAAYRDGEPWRRALIGYLRANLALLGTRLASMPGLRLLPPQATCLAWIDARASGLEDPAAHFEKAGVGLSDGRDFGAPGFMRLNFGCRRATLTEALDRMAAALPPPAAIRL